MAEIITIVAPDISTLSLFQILSINSFSGRYVDVESRPSGFDAEDSLWQMVVSTDRENWVPIGDIYNAEEFLTSNWTSDKAFMALRLNSLGTDTTGVMTVHISVKD